MELLAHRNTGANRVAIENIVVGVQSEGNSAASLCGADDRVSSTDPRAARIMPAGCTGFLFNDRPHCLLTAGHCAGFSMQVVQFNVPLSDCDGTVNHPGPEDQYPVDQGSRQFQDFGPGNDWCQFGAFDNTNTGLSPLEKQGSSYQLVEPPVPDPDPNLNTLRMTGYGGDKTPVGCCDAPACTICGVAACGSEQYNEDSQTQQTASGPYQGKSGTLLGYAIDATPGTSGSPVEHVADSVVYGIHTYPACEDIGENFGTAIDHPELQGALACPKGVCLEPAQDCNANGIADACEADPLAPNLLGDLEHRGPKNRYISVNPNTNCERPVALKVELVSMKRCQGALDESCVSDADCVGNCVEHPDVGLSWWVQQPQQYAAGCLALGYPCADDDWFARLDQTPYFTVWTHSTLHIGDCEIVPVATYNVRICLPPDGAVCTDPVQVATIAKPGTQHYADVVGMNLGYLPPLPGFWFPNRVVDQVDVDAYTLTVQGPSTPSAHMTWIDLHGYAPVSAPNYFLNVSDLQLILFGLNGGTYPPRWFLTPGECGGGESARAEASGSGGGGPAMFTLSGDSNFIAPSQTVEVGVFINPPANASIADLGAYEVALSVTGGEEGALVLTGITVDSDRPDYVFGSAPTVTVPSVFGSRISNALRSGAVSIDGPAYLGTFTYKAGVNAKGVFDVAVRGAGRSFLNDPNVLLLPSDSGQPAAIRVGN